MPTRRDFLTSTAAAALAACTGCRPEGSARRSVSSAPEPANRVAVVRDEDHLAALEAALETAGGIDVQRGDTVVLKVNTNSGDPYPYSTSPDVVRRLADRFRAEGARVKVMDRSFWGDPDTARNFADNGIAAAARKGGAELIVLDESVDWIEIPAELVPDWRPPVRVPRLAIEADRLINLACMKTHFITGCTLALKNLLGLVHAEDRARPGNLRSHGDRIHHQVAQIHRFVRPHLHIVDGWRALIAGGPTPSSGAPSRFADPHVVLASTDPVAVDAAAIEILRKLAPPSEEITLLPAWESAPIRSAMEMGVGHRSNPA
jgi:uncharacterized protein (DUF362 family)